MSKRLILGIDLQEGFLTEEASAAGYTEQVSKFLATQPKDSVILTKFINHPNSNYEKLVGYTDLQLGDPKARLLGDLENQAYEVVEKSTLTAWHPAIAERAVREGITDIIIFGLDTDACVLKTALDIFDAELRPVVLRDLCSSSNGSQAHERGLEILKLQIGEQQVTTSALF